ncbi:hypothetical protein ABZ470_26495 [Streptosporangium sp. NPDC020072]|uniref:hypothetical protein n=1 Tax=Streptosporangium sp. NPDC020072 TaxID=3154788 RepID=UPI00342A74EF
MSRDALAEARRRYEQKRARQIKAGTWRGMIDATKAREHVKNLHRIWLVSYEAIGQLAGIGGTTVSHIAEGTPARQLPPPGRITARVSDALLTVTVDDLPDNYLISTVGAMRRLRALSVAGWPMREVAHRTGADWSGLKSIRRGERTVVLVRTARLIRETYDVLIQLNPYDHCRSTAVTASRKRAMSNGWYPMEAWADAIDDPAVQPWTTIRCSHPTCIRGAKDERLLCEVHLKRLHDRGSFDGMRIIRNRSALIEDIRFVLATDPPINPKTLEIDGERLAERLGTSWAALERALLRANINLNELRERKSA